MENEELEPAGSLENTLPSEKTLPEGTENLGQLDILKLALQEGTRSLKTEGLISNFAQFESTLNDRGIDMTKMHGSVSAGIMDFVSRRTRDPNETLSNFNNLIEMVQKKQKEDVTTSRGMIVNMMNTPGMLATLDEEDVNAWAERTGLDPEYINKFRDIDVTNVKSSDYYAEQITLGNYTLAQVPDANIRALTMNKVDWDNLENIDNNSLYDQLSALGEANLDATPLELRMLAKDKLGDKLKGMSDEDIEEAMMGPITNEDIIKEMVEGPIAQFERRSTSAEKEVTVNVTNYSGSKPKIETKVVEDREALIDLLEIYNPELSRQEIVDAVYGNISDKDTFFETMRKYPGEGLKGFADLTKNVVNKLK